MLLNSKDLHWNVIHIDIFNPLAIEEKCILTSAKVRCFHFLCKVKPLLHGEG